ncbi:RNA polymerase [Obelidium mucronatum]|nr:RNA polymerase [Obelidium mucronatum]
MALTVSRLNATSEAADTEIILDINTEIYPMSISDKFTLSLATSLSLDATAANASSAVSGGKKESWRDTSNQKSLADDYEYVMFGKVYKYDETGGKNKASVYVSFGGLLLLISGEPVDVLVGQELYLLMRKNT